MRREDRISPQAPWWWVRGRYSDGEVAFETWHTSESSMQVEVLAAERREDISEVESGFVPPRVML